MAKQTAFDRAFAHTVKLEGGYVNDPRDPGGETNFGITVRTARRFGYRGSMRRLTRADAKSIYRRGYWEEKRLPLETIAQYHEPLALELFDTGVNMGPSRAARFLQRALNELYGESLGVDGWAGKATVAAMRKHRRPLDKRVLTKLVDHYQFTRYRERAKSNANAKAFLLGWLDKRTR